MNQVARFLGAILIAATALAGEPANEITSDNVLRLMNEQRAAEQLPPLRLDRRLSLAARDRMTHMEEAGFWSHESPDGMSPFVWIPVRAYHYSFAGENLASGFETARLLVESWMESPGHRANIMSPNYADCGIAIIDGSPLGPADGKSVVVMFAREREDPAFLSSAKR